ncbi:MAG: SDR family NAD(P)-dependent oxidoreductase [Mogibacterium sp.]|nr:SDR family NAD(P)-dependent oxidoreductase [Mogibacterium sp.]
MKDFKGRVALITGAAHGFGKEFVKQAAQRGMKIAAVDIMEDALKEIAPLAEELGAEKVLLFPCDVTEYEQVKCVVAKVMEEFGQIDLLMNNAGVATFGPVWAVPPIEYEWIIDTNLKSHIYFMHEVIPIMMKQGTHCNIVNTCSAAGTFTSKSAAAYQSSKFGALALTESVYYDLADAGADIHMSAYCPGFIQTHLDHSEEYKQDKYKIEDPYYGSKYHQAMQGAAAYYIKTGRAIDESGPIVFKAIEDDQLYIITHEHYDKYIQLRCENMLARKNPELIPIDHNIKQ